MSTFIREYIRPAGRLLGPQPGSIFESCLNDENPSAALAGWVSFHHIEWHTAPPKFFEGQEEGSESRGNEHSLLWPTLSQAWQRLKGSLERALEWMRSPANTCSQCSKRQAAQAIHPKAGCLGAPFPQLLIQQHSYLPLWEHRNGLTKDSLW